MMIQISDVLWVDPKDVAAVYADKGQWRSRDAEEPQGEVVIVLRDTRVDPVRLTTPDVTEAKARCAEVVAQINEALK